MSPSRGDSESPEPALPYHVADKRQRTLSFRLDDDLNGNSHNARGSTSRRTSESALRRQTKTASSESSWTPPSSGGDGELPAALSGTPAQHYTASPEHHNDTPLANYKPAMRTQRSATLKAFPSSDVPHSLIAGEHSRRPRSEGRSFTVQHVRPRDWEDGLSSDEGDRHQLRPSSVPRRKRERAKSLHASTSPPVTSNGPSRLTDRIVSASSPGLAQAGYLTPPMTRRDSHKDSSASSEALPKSPAISGRPSAFEVNRRRSLRDTPRSSRRREVSASRPRLLSEMILPNSSTHESLADIASTVSEPGVAANVADAPPATREPTLKELIESVPLDQALSLYQSVNRGTQRTFNEPADLRKSTARPTSPLTLVLSGDSAAPSSQKHLLPDDKAVASADKERKRERKISLGLHLGKTKKARDQVEEYPQGSQGLALTPTLTGDRAFRTPGERHFDDLISRTHLQTSPVTFARANECRNYLEARYTPIFTDLQEHRAITNLLDVARWRSRVREEQFRAHGLAGSTSTVRPHLVEMPLIAGKPLPHRNKRTRDFELYPDETLAYLEAQASPVAPASPNQASPPAPARRRRDTMMSESSDRARPLPRGETYGSVAVYASARVSDHGSTTSLPQSRYRSPSISSLQGYHINGVLKSSGSPPPASAVHRSGSFLTGTRVPASRIGSVKANLSRKLKTRDRSSAAGHRSSGSDVPASPYLSETDFSEPEGVARLRHSNSKADSLTRSRWRHIRAGGEDRLPRIEARQSAGGPSILGGPLSEADVTAELASLVEEEDPRHSLSIIDIDDEEEERLNRLLGDAHLAVSRAQAFAPRCPTKIANYLENLTAYDLASRVAARQLSAPPLVPPELPQEIALEVQRAIRAERILRPFEQELDDELGNDRHIVEDRIVEESEDESFSGSSGASTDTESSEQVVVKLSPIPHAPRRRGPLRRQSLADFQPTPKHSLPLPNAGTNHQAAGRSRRMTVATSHPQDSITPSGVRPDPLPGVLNSMKALEQALSSAHQEARAGSAEVAEFHERATKAHAQAEAELAALSASNLELSHLGQVVERQSHDQKSSTAANALWSMLSWLLEGVLRSISISYTCGRILSMPLRVIWAILTICIYGMNHGK